jgi:hypothetical protein
MKHILLVILLLLSGSHFAISQNFDTKLLPELYSPSNAGTEFYVSFIPTSYQPMENFNLIKFYFVSSSNATVRIKVPLSFIDTTLVVKPNAVTEYSVASKFMMPYQKDFKKLLENNISAVIPKRAVEIKSDAPVVCYSIVRFQGYAEGFMLIPKSSWGNEYNISTSKDFRNQTTEFGTSTAVIVSAYDNSRVTFRLGGNQSTKIFKSAGDSVVTGGNITETLNAGDVWVIPSLGLNNDLTGSYIHSTKPIAVYTGNDCTQIPTNLTPCNYLMEQELPNFSFSKRYYVTPIYGRSKGSYVKVSAASGNTDVKLNGNFKGKIIENYGVEDVGYLQFRVDDDNKPAIISSDSRINVVQFNTGNDSPDDKSYPFKMQVLSNDHFSIVLSFASPATQSSKYFTKNYINIITKLDDGGQIPDNLILKHFENGNLISSKQVREIALNEPLMFPEYENDGKHYYCVTVELAQTGRYVINSDMPVGAVMYGSTQNDSYGYPAGMKIINQNKILDTITPKVEITKLANGSFTGIITDEPANSSSIRSNLGLIHFVADSTYNYVLNYDDFIPGTTNSSTFEIHPKSIIENGRAFLRIVDFAGNDTIIQFFYSNIPPKPQIKINDFTEKKLCSGSKYTIKFEVSDGEFLPQNKFRIKLAKPIPTQGYPLIIGEISGASLREGEFTLPLSLSSAGDYMIYIESTVPTSISDTISDIEIVHVPDINISGIKNVCENNTYRYSSSDISGLTYKWTVENGSIVGPDDARDVVINWIQKGTGTVTLNYTLDNSCNVTKKYEVLIGDDYENVIEGQTEVCVNEEIFYNSVIQTGKFEWGLTGGEFVGGTNDYLVRIKWINSGKNNIELTHTNNEGFTKIFNLEVNVNKSPDKPVITRDKDILISSAATGNQWYFNSNLIQGARAKTYDTKNVSGNYSVQVTENNCQSEFSDIYEFGNISVNYDEINEFVNIYPNPASDIVNIELKSGVYENLRILLFDNQFNYIDEIADIKGITENKNIQFLTDKILSGFYILKLESLKGSHYYRLIIVK